MWMFVDGLKNRTAIRLALAGLTAALLAGCSAGDSRYSDPFSNPFKDSARFSGSDSTATGSVAPTRAVPTSRISSSPLSGSVGSAPLAPVRPIYSAALSAPYHPSPSINPTPARSRFDQVAAARVRHDDLSARTKHGVWNAQGGVRITVRAGDTAQILATRYEVPLKDLLRVNGLRSPEQVHPGSSLVIPVYSAAGARPSRRSARRRAPVGRPEARLDRREKLRFVKGPSGRSSRPQDRRDEARRADHDSRHAEREDHSQQKEALAEKARREQEMHASLEAAKARLAAAKEARLQPGKNARTAERTARNDPSATGSLAPQAKQVASAASTNASARPRFSWPARGRIIEGFKAGRNDGINIAVPDGTIVKAAASGVVAYAGNELKGYGNLVLIRHPNGFVSAYADNGQLEVKRGQSVRRGQTIAKSGQSGNVSSPQLHFELRKGQTPVDPTRYLAGL